MWPRVKPVDGAAINQRRKFATANSQSGTHRWETENNLCNSNQSARYDLNPLVNVVTLWVWFSGTLNTFDSNTAVSHRFGSVRFASGRLAVFAAFPGDSQHKREVLRVKCLCAVCPLTAFSHSSLIFALGCRLRMAYSVWPITVVVPQSCTDVPSIDVWPGQEKASSSFPLNQTSRELWPLPSPRWWCLQFLHR